MKTEVLELTHADLVIRAARWLSNSAGCRVVAAEPVTAAGECPDAIGWGKTPIHSIKIECKVSRADFLADRKKRHNSNGMPSMGMFKYYMVPKGLISPDEVPDRFGLLEVGPRVVRRTKKAKIHMDFDFRGELQILVSRLRIAQLIMGGEDVAGTSATEEVFSLLESGGWRKLSPVSGAFEIGDRVRLKHDNVVRGVITGLSISSNAAGDLGSMAKVRSMSRGVSYEESYPLESLEIFPIPTVGESEHNEE